jgi:single-stranded DNA-specific DHH superfamily exonuclease
LDLKVEWYSADGETGTAIIWKMAKHLHSKVDGALYAMN